MKNNVITVDAHFRLPVIVSEDRVAFPYETFTFAIETENERAAIRASRACGSMVFLVLKNPEEDAPFNIGVIARVTDKTSVRHASSVNMECMSRASSGKYEQLENVLYAEVDAIGIDEEAVPHKDAEAHRLLLDQTTEKISQLLPVRPKDFMKQYAELPTEIGYRADFVASQLLIQSTDKQMILCKFDPLDRVSTLVSLLEQQVELIFWMEDLRKKAAKQIEQNQKEYFLREQIKVLESELGNDGESELDEMYNRIVKAKNLPKEVREKLLKEFARLEKAPFGSPEATVLNTYLDVCLEIPFGKKTEERTDLGEARKILDADHDGLQKVKERILEFIAVKQFNPDVKNQILCFVGAPGVGKTSLGASIARALKRKYVRISLGGVRDEADIRGHRKTYVGAMPGRIVAALSECGSCNPVMVLDEIDKMANDGRGDPASAMLEVLDSAQNKAFRDHFVEMPVDLSDCMFIATANRIENIPAPLIDRMEIIEIPSYTHAEKRSIAKKHLIPKQRKASGLKATQLHISDGAVDVLISDYTEEAGVRNLEREIASLCRKAAKRLIETGAKSVRIDEKNVSVLLGKKKVFPTSVSPEPEVGIVNGMAYTEAGGDLLKIEVSVMQGKGNLKLTGQLGDVMKESAELAYTYVRSHATDLGIDPTFPENRDLHLHVPEGAVPKDGPSAGVSMATAMASALSGRAVRSDVSMTGEITLTGKVLPIGGLREKSNAAYAAGVRRILIPAENMRDLEDVDREITENATFVPCKTLSDVFAEALLPMPGNAGRAQL